MEEKKETIEEVLGDIRMQLMDANIMRAMVMLHDEPRCYSKEERGYLSDIAGIPFAEVDDGLGDGGDDDDVAFKVKD